MCVVVGLVVSMTCWLQWLCVFAIHVPLVVEMRMHSNASYSITSPPSHTSPSLTHIPLPLSHRFIDHGGQADQLAEAGLSVNHIAATALTVLGKPRDSVVLT